MIRPASLRLGNILTLCYEDSFNPYTVEVLQADLVHLSGRPEADDPRDVLGLPITEEFLITVNFKKYGNQYKAHFNKIPVSVEFDIGTDLISLHVNLVKFTIKDIHELQNILFFNTGWEIPFFI